LSFVCTVLSALNSTSCFFSTTCSALSFLSSFWINKSSSSFSTS
jgi:hypothetical protein